MRFKTQKPRKGYNIYIGARIPEWIRKDLGLRPVSDMPVAEDVLPDYSYFIYGPL
ncbi:MAG: hypothetical protein LBS19_03825 [Clostridiales bacterium]|jgi:hypothetical protein|nr:hypothetical protein [Clostridiales bacterium]